MERNILLTIEYDGSGFSGWQRQPGRRTVQGELERVLSRLCACDILINGTSRTDAGVHALGQRASFKGEFGIPTERIMRAANNLLAGGQNSQSAVGDVRITEVREMPLDFHARFDSKGKTYRYIIRNCPDVDVFKRRYCYQVQKPLDTDKMRQAAGFIVGTHDFKCFQAAGGNERLTTVRTIHRLDIHRQEENVIIEVTGGNTGRGGSRKEAARGHSGNHRKRRQAECGTYGSCGGPLSCQGILRKLLAGKEKSNEKTQLG